MDKKILGQDKWLKKEIYKRLIDKKAFFLCGQQGIGKTAILKFSYNHYPNPKIPYQKETNPKKLFLSCNISYGQIVKEIARAQNINSKSKTVSELETLTIKAEKITLFLDDLERAGPKILKFLVALNDIWEIFIAGREPIREEAKRLLWGKEKLRVKPIDKSFRKKLAEYCVSETGSKIPVSDIATQSRGVPGRAWAIARGEKIRHESDRVEDEEINIAPVLLIFLAGLIAFRYVSRGLGETGLVLLAGALMGASVLLRYLVYTLGKK